ncbi:MAG: copper chaperone PCu(A)C [Xylophilus ampelinus]
MHRGNPPATRALPRPPFPTPAQAGAGCTPLRFALAAAVALLAPGTAAPRAPHPAEAAAGDAPVEIRDAWVRPAFALPAGTGAYLVLRARTPLRLVGGHAAAAGAVRVRTTVLRDGVGLLEDAPDGVALAPGRPVALAPGGDFLGLDDLRRPLRTGERLRLRLDFRDESGRTRTREVLATVRTGPPGQPAPHGHGHLPAPDPGHGHVPASR